MNKTGNSNKGQCIQNLLRMTRGDVHLDQLRGLRSDLIDMPATTAEPHMRANVFWLVEHYEPRVSGVDFTADLNPGGDMTATASVQ